MEIRQYVPAQTYTMGNDSNEWSAWDRMFAAIFWAVPLTLCAVLAVKNFRNIWAWVVGLPCFARWLPLIEGGYGALAGVGIGLTCLTILCPILVLIAIGQIIFVDADDSVRRKMLARALAWAVMFPHFVVLQDLLLKNFSNLL